MGWTFDEIRDVHHESNDPAMALNLIQDIKHIFFNIKQLFVSVRFILILNHILLSVRLVYLYNLGRRNSEVEIKYI